MTFHDLRCRLKPYPETVFVTFMVEIACPHCDEDLELDDDEFGLFVCPYCEEEFEWGKERTKIEIQPASDFSVSELYNVLPAGFFIAGLIITGLILLWIVMGFANAMSCGWQATC